MVIISDNADGLPISVYVTSTASPHHEVITLAEASISTKCFITDEKPEHLISDKTYDSDPLDARLAIEYAVELISSHRLRRKRPKTLDGRPLRRYKRSWWKIEERWSVAQLSDDRCSITGYSYFIVTNILYSDTFKNISFTIFS
jgi:hypothetical protein